MRIETQFFWNKLWDGRPVTGWFGRAEGGDWFGVFSSRESVWAYWETASHRAVPLGLPPRAAPLAKPAAHFT